MKKFYPVFLLIFISLNSFSQFKNIKLAEQDDKSLPPAEPSIAINKKNPKNISFYLLNHLVLSFQQNFPSKKHLG